MNGKRFHFLMIGLTGLFGIAIFGSVLLANQLLKQQSKKLYDLKLQSQVLSQKQVALSKALKDINQYSELEREAKLIVPQDKDQAEAVREIVNIAKASGVSITSIIFPSSTLGNTPAKSSGSTPSTQSTKTPSISQTQAVPGLKGVYTMPITVQATNSPVAYSNLVKFLNRLEQNRRTSQVSSLNIQPLATDPGKVNFTLIVNAYIKP